jgi:8-oxo-dGTP diphosphatase
MIEAVGPSAPDRDSGYTYRRLMTSAMRAARLLAWGRTGEQQARAAALAGHRLGLATNQPPADSYV